MATIAPQMRVKLIEVGGERTRLTLRERLFNALYPIWNRAGLVRGRKALRVRRMFDAIGFDPDAGGLLLEVGCGNGQDLVSHLTGRNVSVYGMDIDDYGIAQSNFTFVKGDAARMPFLDKHFDAVVSIGVLEHIEPMSKLLAMIGEIDRVSKSYAIVVPSVSTLLEPHTMIPLWQLRALGHKRAVPALNFFSDEAWLQFDGFLGASIKRFFHIPPIIANLLIYKRG